MAGGRRWKEAEEGDGGEMVVEVDYKVIKIKLSP